MIALRSRLVALTLGLVSCAVDDRELKLALDDDGIAGAAQAGKAGATRGGGAGKAGSDSDAGGGDESSSGGSSSGSSAGGGPKELVDGCADLDTDGVADCTATVLENPTFGRDIESWTVTGDARLTWDAKNALSDLPSGSVKLDTSVRLSGATQCVKLDGEHVVIVYANAFIEAGSELARAQLAVSFFADEGCSGEQTGYFETPTTAVVDEWTTLQAGSLSRDATRSASIALIGVKADVATELTAYFDNVMLKVQAP